MRSGHSRIAKLITKNLDDPISQLRDEYEISEAVHLLVEIAIYCRAAQDMRLKALKIEIDWMREPVGTLWPSTEVRKGEDLDFRESCNKVIHAEDITWDVLDENKGDKRFLKPFVYLYGTKREGKIEKSWKAKLDSIKFVQEAYKLLRLV